MTQILSLLAGSGVIAASVLWVAVALDREARAASARLAGLALGAGVGAWA